MATDWKRRALDRAEQRVLEMEKRLVDEINRYGVPNFSLTMGLSQAYVARARERVHRKQETPEDIAILNKVDRR